MEQLRISDWGAVTRTAGSPASVVQDAARNFPGHHDLDAIEDAYRARVARLLPPGIALEGQTFWVDADDFGVDADWAASVRRGIQSIDLAPYFAARWALQAA